MFSPVIYLMMNSLFFTLRLSGGSGSFPRPLKAAEERDCLERCAQGDMDARNRLVEHNLRLVAHIVNNGVSKRRTLEPLRRSAVLSPFRGGSVSCAACETSSCIYGKNPI